MNKFHLTMDSFWFSIGIGAIVYLASSVSDTPRYISFLAAALLSSFAYFYFAFIEKNKCVLTKWLDKSAVTFLNLIFMTMLAYFDFILYGWN